MTLKILKRAADGKGAAKTNRWLTSARTLLRSSLPLVDGGGGNTQCS